MTIARLNAFNGLFLRAEHLERMQEYTRSLAYALGQSGGPGVVHGYSAKLSPNGLKLVVDPGLAIGSTGRPFLLQASAELDLTNPEVTGQKAGAGTLRMIMVTGKDTRFGKENVYGDLCAGASVGNTEPYIAEEAVIRIGELPLAGPSDTSDGTLRSLVSSKWFAHERDLSGPWIAATDQADRTDILRGDWGSGFALPAPADPDAVPLGLLLCTSKAWVLDVWTLRRERTDPPPRRVRQAQLGLRPWDVFIAQVLQFQDMLAAGWPGAIARRSAAATADDMNREVRRNVEEAKKHITSKRAQESLAAVLELVPKTDAATAVTAGPPRLTDDLGILELPPAGFLPQSAGAQSSVQEWISAMFPRAVQLNFRSCPADAVVSAVEGAQHLRRISLTPSEGKTAVPVDILVPDGVESADGLTTERPWVAFRRHADCCLDGLESVDLHLYAVSSPDDGERLVAGLTDGSIDPTASEAAEHHVVRYPVGGWVVPENQSGVERWKEGGGSVTAIGLAGSVENRVLTAGRAAMFLDLFPHAPGDDNRGAGGVFAAVRTGLTRDAIVLVRHPERIS
ncbi:hypothetical protein [Streptomyces sp. NPDC047525]|uniref:hypothetical protein n=1 Tax=Streptomyces sp. NPDC047525 TaxID=3155264 RepID=UPI0033C6B054